MSAEVIDFIDRMAEPKRTEIINRNAARALQASGVPRADLHLVDDKILYMSPPYMAPPTDCA